jgi:hypothetical protein
VLFAPFVANLFPSISAHGSDARSHLDRLLIQPPDANSNARDPHLADGIQPGRRNTTALRAIGIASELAWADSALQVRRNRLRCICKNAFGGIRGWI